MPTKICIAENIMLSVLLQRFKADTKALQKMLEDEKLDAESIVQLAELVFVDAMNFRSKVLDLASDEVEMEHLDPPESNLS